MTPRGRIFSNPLGKVFVLDEHFGNIHILNISLTIQIKANWKTLFSDTDIKQSTKTSKDWGNNYLSHLSWSCTSSAVYHTCATFDSKRATNFSCIYRRALSLPDLKPFCIRLVIDHSKRRSRSIHLPPEIRTCCLMTSQSWRWFLWETRQETICHVSP